MNWLQVHPGVYISRDAQSLIKRHETRSGDSWLLWRLQELENDYEWRFDTDYESLEDAQEGVSESILV